MEKPNDNHSASHRAPTSEADFLADQVASAQQAVSATLVRMREDLGESADLTQWAKRYPWPTLGIAAALGFLTVVTIDRSVGARAQKSSMPPDDDARNWQPTKPMHAEQGKGHDGLFYSLMSEILRNFATAAQGALLAAISARFQSPPPVDDSAAPADDSAAPADPTVAEASADVGSDADATSASQG